MVELSVVIPVYNSEACLEPLALQLEEALRGLTHELILVDDQSADSSWSVIRKLCAADPATVGIRLRKNAGQNCAILCGLRKARGRFVVIMDDDLQHSPYDIPTLLEQCKSSDWDVCYARFPKRKQAAWKNAGSWLNGKLANIVLSKPKGLYLSPFKVMKQEIVAEVIKYTGAFPYVDGLILGVTSAVGEVAVEHHERYSGKGNFGVAKSVLLFLRVLTGFSIWPLRFASGFGATCAACGFGLALFYLTQYVFFEHRVEGWVTLVVLNLVIGGLVMLSLGLIGEYLGRLYLNSNGKPQSTIKETCNVE